MSDRPAPGKYDQAGLLDVVQFMLAEGRDGASTEAHPGQAVYAAYVRLSREEGRHGRMAGQILFWITGGQGDPAALDAADEILNGSAADPRRAKVHEIVRRLARGEITWDDFAKATKKGLIPKRRSEVAVPSPDSIALADASKTLTTMPVQSE